MRLTFLFVESVVALLAVTGFQYASTEGFQDGNVHGFGDDFTNLLPNEESHLGHGTGSLTDSTDNTGNPFDQTTQQFSCMAKCFQDESDHIAKRKNARRAFSKPSFGGSNFFRSQPMNYQSVRYFGRTITEDSEAWSKDPTKISSSDGLLPHSVTAGSSGGIGVSSSKFQHLPIGIPSPAMHNPDQPNGVETQAKPFPVNPGNFPPQIKPSTELPGMIFPKPIPPPEDSDHVSLPPTFVPSNPSNPWDGKPEGNNAIRIMKCMANCFRQEKMGQRGTRYQKSRRVMMPYMPGTGNHEGRSFEQGPPSSFRPQSVFNVKPNSKYIPHETSSKRGMINLDEDFTKVDMSNSDLQFGLQEGQSGSVRGGFDRPRLENGPQYPSDFDY